MGLLHYKKGYVCRKKVLQIIKMFYGEKKVLQIIEMFFKLRKKWFYYSKVFGEPKMVLTLHGSIKNL